MRAVTYKEQAEEGLLLLASIEKSLLVLAEAAQKMMNPPVMMIADPVGDIIPSVFASLRSLDEIDDLRRQASCRTQSAGTKE